MGHKLWKAARRAGHDIGRDQVARLMKTIGIEGVRRGRRIRTTRPDDQAARSPDLVERNFAATEPNRLWVTDLTFVPTWQDVAYVCFIVDALEMARWQRGAQLEGLVAHSDAGSQYTSIRYGERLAELGATPSIGSIGDSYDNALAETVNGLYKTELVYGLDQGPWRKIEDVELATLSWVHWFNSQRLQGYLDDVPPIEYEEAHYAQPAPTGR